MTRRRKVVFIGGAALVSILTLCVACVAGSVLLNALGVLPTPTPTSGTAAVAALTTAGPSPAATTLPTVIIIPPTGTAPIMPPILTSIPPSSTPIPPTVAPIPPTLIIPPSATATTAPASRPQLATMQPTATVAPTATLNSGGLALGEAEWERLYGKGQKSNANRNYVSYPSIENDKYGVTYDYVDRSRFSGPTRITKIRRNWGPEAVSLDAARTESTTLIPVDAQLIRTYISEDGATKGKTVDLYKSEWLKSQIPSELWMFHRVEAGTFAVIYDLNLERRINTRNGRPFDATMTVGIGSNP